MLLVRLCRKFMFWKVVLSWLVLCWSVLSCLGVCLILCRNICRYIRLMILVELCI